MMAQKGTTEKWRWTADLLGPRRIRRTRTIRAVRVRHSNMGVAKTATLADSAETRHENKVYESRKYPERSKRGNGKDELWLKSKLRGAITLGARWIGDSGLASTVVDDA